MYKGTTEKHQNNETPRFSQISKIKVSSEQKFPALKRRAYFVLCMAVTTEERPQDV
jgi:hypothetical protein